MAPRTTAPIAPEQLVENLRQFHGSESRFRHPLNHGVLYTEGVHHLAEEAGAFWLIDAIASYFGSPKMRRAIKADERLETLQFWHLAVSAEKQEATLTARADKGVPPFVTQHIGYTDFPLSEIDIWAGFNGRFWTLYLPSEH